MGKFALGEEFVEGRDGTRVGEFVGAFREIDFGRLLQRRIHEGDAGRVSGCGDGFVGPWPSVEFVQRVAGLGDGVHGSLGSDASGGQHSFGDGVVLDWADEIFAPLLDGAGFIVGLFTVDPVEMRLEIAVRAGWVIFAGEENVATVVGPVEAAFVGLVVG